ncbi:unnamed protein product [Brassicogethes aeneus]|uniref:GST C-terminal domain-containing protein n=1 Tax=Brassicogethes aeneus TaxID=1431903 RepID=A0A9P0AQT4_BRAAE|nr:unnamed protein product [Brassicogethes aeneus]
MQNLPLLIKNPLLLNNPKLFVSECCFNSLAIKLTASSINLNIYEEKVVGETELKLVDSRFILVNTQTILSYLVDKYAPNNSIYPKDLYKRAMINQILFFDNGTLGNKIQTILHQKISEENVHSLEESYKTIEQLLVETEYISGEHLTIADFCIVSSLIVAFILAPPNFQNYPKTEAWFKKIKSHPACVKHQGDIDNIEKCLKERKNSE